MFSNKHINTHTHSTIRNVTITMPFWKFIERTVVLNKREYGRNRPQAVKAIVESYNGLYKGDRC